MDFLSTVTAKPIQVCRNRKTAAVANVGCWNSWVEMKKKMISLLGLFFTESTLRPQGHNSIAEMTLECKLFWRQVAFHFCLNAFIPVLYLKFYIWHQTNQSDGWGLRGSRLGWKAVVILSNVFYLSFIRCLCWDTSSNSISSQRTHKHVVTQKTQWQSKKSTLKIQLKCIMSLTEEIIGSLEHHSPAVNLCMAQWWRGINTLW